MRVVTLNIGSNKKNITRVIERYKDYDVIAIPEAGLTSPKVWVEGMGEYNNWSIHRSKVHAKDSILLMVHKDWEAKQITTGIERSKSVQIQITKEESIDIHLVYGPCEHKDKYWEKWKSYLINQDETNRTNIILGDLNNTTNPAKDRLGHTNEKTNALVDLIHEAGIVDVVEPFLNEQRYTWMGIRNGETQASRIDHILADPILVERVRTASIKNFDRNLSPDHAAVTAELTFQNTTKIQDRSQKEPQIIETVDTETLKEEQFKYKREVQEIVEQLETQDKDKTPAERWENLASQLLEAAQRIGGTRKREINGKKIVHSSDKEKSLRTNLRRLSRAIGSSLHLKPGDPETKRIKALEANQPPYKLAKPMDGDWKSWREQAEGVKSKLAKEMEREETKRTNKRIRKLVKELRESQKTNPRNFFKKLKGETQKGSLYRVRTEDGKRIAKAREVKEEVAKVWGKMWQDKPYKQTKDCSWFQTEGFKELAKKIQETDTSMKPLTEQEVEEAMNCYSKRHKAPGVDNIVPEVIHFAKDELKGYMTKIFNDLITPKEDGTRNELPRDWKLTRIFLLYKESTTSNEENPLDYRPISLLCVPYKILVTIIEKRLRAFHEPFFTETQGGFRPNRSCGNKSLTLANLLEDAKKHNKEIHICFLDLAKAYDSVNPEEVTDTMHKMGYDLDTLALLDHLNTSCQGRVMTPHGDTDEFYFQGGLRQGDPLSPLLFIIFLEPLLIQLQESKKGYTMEEKDEEENDITIEGESFADDQALIASSRENLQEIFDIAVNFYNYYQLRLNLSSKNKTAYMTTSRKGGDLIYTKRDNTNQVVPKLEPEEAYTYLGIKLNAEASWGPQEKAISAAIGLHLLNIQNRAITPLQKVYIANRVLIPAIEYRLQVAEIETKVLQSWNARIARSILRSCGWEYGDGFEIAFYPRELGGLGLTNLHDVNIQAKVQSYITLGANGKDKHTIRTLEGMSRNEPNRITRLNTNMKRLKLRVEKLEQNENRIGTVTPFVSEKMKSRITQEDDTLKIVTEYKYKHSLTRNGLQAIRKQVAPHYASHPNTMNLITEGKHSLGKELFQEDEAKENTYEAWTDGSYDPTTDVAGSAFTTHSSQDRGKYLAVKSPYKEKSYAAELYAVWLLLSMAKPDFNLTVYIDNESAMTSIQAKEKGEREKRRDPMTPLIQGIKNLIEERTKGGTKTEFKHVYSHLLETSPTEESKRKTAIMMERYGNRWKEIAEGNAKADGYAKQALTGTFITESITNERYKFGMVDRMGISKEKHQTGLRKTIKTRIKKLREEEAKQDLKRKTEATVEKENLPLLRLDEELIAREQVLLIKLLWKKLKTRDRMFNRVQGEKATRANREETQWEKENKERLEKREKAYQSPNCPWGCTTPETTKHVFVCEENDGPNLHEALKGVLEEVEGGNTWKTEKPWTAPLKGEKGGFDGKIQQLTENQILAGLVPNNLEKFLPQSTKEDTPSKVKKVFVQKEMLEIIHRRWILRCKHLFKKEKQPKQRKERTEETTRERTKRKRNEKESNEKQRKKRKGNNHHQQTKRKQSGKDSKREKKKRKTLNDYILERYTTHVPLFMKHTNITPTITPLHQVT